MTRLDKMLANEEESIHDSQVSVDAVLAMVDVMRDETLVSCMRWNNCRHA